MANGVYDAGIDALMGSLDWVSDDIKVVLVDVDDYTVDLEAHEDLADIPAGARVGTSSNLTGKAVTSGVVTADDAVFSSVTGDELEAAVVYYDSGVEATSTLIAYIDTGVGFPLTPDGGGVVLYWNDGVVLELAQSERSILVFADETEREASNPDPGTMGWQSDTGVMYVYVDGATPIWVAIQTGAEYVEYTPAIHGTTTDPTLSDDNSHVTQGWYLQNGNHVTGWFRIVFGTSGVNAGAGYYAFELPVAADLKDDGGVPIGIGYMTDTSDSNKVYNAAALFLPTAAIFGSSSTRCNVLVSEGQFSLGTNPLSATSPFTWADGDSIGIQFEYEAV